MKRFGIRIYLLLPALVVLSACNLAAPVPVPATAAPTAVTVLTDPATATAEAVAATPAEAQALPSSTATTSPTPEATATSTPVPVAPSPTPELPSPTPDARPMLTVDTSLTTAVNVRSGPGTNYSIVGQLQPGQSAMITGRSEDSSWWQLNLAGAGEAEEAGWIYGQLVTLTGDGSAVAVAAAPPPPTPAPEPTPAADPPAAEEAEAPPPSPEELEEQLRCGKDFCVTYQAMVPIWENGGCIGNHSIYITVLEGPPPGRPMDGVVIGDTFNNVEVASGDKGPGQTEITLWMNSMSLTAKRHIDGTPYTSEESYNFTSHDELIPAEVLAANGYCDGSIEKCRTAQQTNNVCRGHYSWRVTFHKFD